MVCHISSILGQYSAVTRTSNFQPLQRVLYIASSNVQAYIRRMMIKLEVKQQITRLLRTTLQHPTRVECTL